jgi:hypothetical protein
VRLLTLLLAAALVAAPSTLAAQTIVIDDQDGAAAGFTTTGNDWTTWGTLGYGFDGGDTDYHYLSHTVGGSDRVGTASWTPDIPTAGTWEITTWFRRTDNRTDDADHFIYDGAGGVTHISLDQRGNGASGWVDLGQHWCAQGGGGCSVTLDGTDDNQSDEANAVRFVLVTPDEDPPEPEPQPGCDEFPGLGAHSQEAWATTAAAVDWADPSLATGAPDGAEAQSPNVDAGEYLHGAGWNLCDPPGDETIDQVTIEVLARTQYSSGQYALDLLLHAGGAAQTVFTGTSLAWHGVDVTSDLGAPTWIGAAGLTGQLQLAAHPGGERDSDAWVDAWRIVVDYTTTAAPGDDDDAADDDDATPPDPVDDDDATPDEPDDDDDATPDEPPVDDDDATDEPDDQEDLPGSLDDDDVDGPDGDDADGSVAQLDACACDQTVEPELALLPLLLLPLGLRRRRVVEEGAGH